MQIKRIAFGGIIMTVIMFSGCSTTVQNLAIGEEKTLETGKTEQESEYSCAMKSHFRKFGNQMSGSGNHLCKYMSLLA